MLGLHWLGEASGCDGAALADERVLRRLLLEIPRSASLTPVSDPVVISQADGLVGMVLLAESHASIHTLPASGTAFVDLFSCARFDPEAVEAVVRAALCPTALHSELVERGPR